MMVKILGKIEPEIPSTGLQSKSSIPDIARNIISPVLTAAEQVAGLPGDIAQSISNVLLPGFETEPGKPLKVPISSQGLRENVREPLSRYFGIERYTLPQGKLEERWNQFIGDTASILTSRVNLPRALKIAGLGNLSGLLSHQLGASEGVESGIKLGTMLLSSLHGGRSSLQNQYENKYKTVQEGIKDITLPAHELEHNLNNFIKRTEAGGLSPAKKEALEQAKHLGTQIMGTTIPAENVWQFKKDINQALGRIKSKDPAKKYFEQLIGIAKENLKPIGPALYGDLSQADEIFGALQASNKLGNFIGKLPIWDSIKNPYIKAALGIGTGITGLKIGLPKVVTLGTAGALSIAGGAANEGFKFMSLLSRSPQARKTYTDLVTSALKGNALVANKELAKLDKIASHEEQKNPSSRYKVLGKINPNPTTSQELTE